jgi:hypothetical protein
MTRLASEHDQPHIRSPFMAADQHPAFGGKAQEDATILLAGLSSHGDLRSASHEELRVKRITLV